MAAGRASEPRTALPVGHLLLLTTAIGWGLNWAVLKAVLRDWPPLFARGVAGLIACGLLASLALKRGDSLRVPRALHGRLGLAATINVFAWMGFTALCLNWLSVAEGALLAYSMPIWATFMAWPLMGERPTTNALIALVLGVAGLVVLMAPSATGFGALGDKLPGVTLAVAAAVLFAYGAVTGRQPLPLSPVVATAWQVGLGCLPMVVLGLVVEHPDVCGIGPVAALGVAYMALGPMAACYLTWFAALRRMPATTAATGMLLVPVIGTLAAVPLLGEELGVRQVLAFGLTLGGVGLALRQRSDTRPTPRTES